MNHRLQLRHLYRLAEDTLYEATFVKYHHEEALNGKENSKESIKISYHSSNFFQNLTTHTITDMETRQSGQASFGSLPKMPNCWDISSLSLSSNELDTFPLLKCRRRRERDRPLPALTLPPEAAAEVALKL